MLFLASQPQIARACIGCMILHARKCIFHPKPHQYWRGLRPFIQLHEKRHMKRAGEAGVVLRARGYYKEKPSWRAYFTTVLFLELLDGVL